MDEKKPKINPLNCSWCGRPNLLDDNDAGSDREEQGLCLKCFNMCECKKFGYEVCYICGSGLFSH